MSDLRDLDCRSYYIDKYGDEIMPCDCTLEAWADWMTRPDPDWRPNGPEQDGARFQASVTRWLSDIIATRGEGGWVFSRDPDDAGFLAVRFGQGMGWSPENIIWGEDMASALREWFVENDNLCDDQELVAVGIYGPKVILTFRAGPPASLAVASIQ